MMIGKCKKSQRNKPDSSKGAALMIVIVLLMLVSLVVSLSYISPVLRMYQNTKKITISNNTFLAAETGTEDYIYRVINSLQTPAQSTIIMGDSQSTTTIATIGGITKEIETISETSQHTRKMKVVIVSNTTDLPLDYGALVGEGGATMDNNAEVRGTEGANGNMYSNGAVAQLNNALVTGDIHAATDVHFDQVASSTVCDTDIVTGNTDPYIDYAQRFTPSETDVLNNLGVYMKKIGNPSSVTVNIVGDDSGQPDSTVLVSGVLDRNKVTSTYAWVFIPFSSTYTLNAGMSYWIIIDANQFSSKYWYWCGDSMAGYSDGSAVYTSDSSSPSWSAATEDLTFKIALGEGGSVIEGAEVQGDAWALSIVDSYIWGDAYYQDISGTTVIGTEYPDSGSPPLVEPPVADIIIDSWVDAADTGGVISGNCPGADGCADSMGPVQIDGDWTLENNVTAEITGTVHVTGNFDANNGVVIECAPSFGDASCAIVVDGTININNNVAMEGSGNEDSFLVMASRLDSCKGGSPQQSECLSDNAAVYVENNGSGGVIYAPNSHVVLENNADVSAVVSYSLDMNSNAYITYDPDLVDMSVSGPGGSDWSITRWREIK